MSGNLSEEDEAVDWHLVGRYTKEKLQQRNTYVMTFIVGTLINVYGQLLVPILRGNPDPWGELFHKFKIEPGLALLSVVLGYFFPFVVSTTSAVLQRYQHRRFESRALFPDYKPDPVFRASSDGTIVDAGAFTRRVFNERGVGRVQELLGEDIWSRIVAHESERRAGELLNSETEVECAPLGGRFLVVHSTTHHGEINIYMTRRQASSPAASPVDEIA